MSEKMGPPHSPENHPPLPKSSEAPVDTSAIKPGPAADNPKSPITEPEPTDANKEPEPPTPSAKP